MAQVVFAALLTALSAVLLMSVQPLATKDCLPLLGGTPAVWAITLVFFQITLLLGYATAIPLARMGTLARCLILTPTLALALCFLPPRIDPEALAATMGESWPWWPLLLALARGFFFPVLAISMSAPLVQAWLAKTRQGLDPTPLYAASNGGSLAGLLAYPLLLEPLLNLTQQGLLWSVGHALWCTGIVGGALWFRPTHSGPALTPQPKPTPPDQYPWKVWLAASAFPSMLMVALTTHLVTDVAGAPLLGILPLAIYLVSFILAFGSSKASASPAWLSRAQVLSALILALLWGVGSVEVRGGLAFPLLLAHLVCFLLLTWGTHRRLVETRPAPEGLPWFYFALSLGGVLGGIAAALLAPILLSRAGIWEYPIALAGCCLFQPGGPIFWTKGDPLRVAIAALAAMALAALAWMLDLGPGGPRWALIVGLPLLAAHLASFRPGLHTALLAIALLVAKLAPDPTGRLIWQERSFFGLARVEQTNGPSKGETITRLVHGGTIHGQACPSWVDKQGKVIPLGYYHPRGPAGDLLSLPEGSIRRQRVAAIGLGVGALAYYARPGEDWTFFEIDPLMERLARRAEWFPYLQNCQGTCKVALGDGRLRLASQPQVTFDLIILDAFSSDSIPAHLLTTEAMAVYTAKLAPGGKILAHISNRYLDLLPVLSGLGQGSGMPVLTWWDSSSQAQGDAAKGWMASHWVILGERPKGLKGLWTPPQNNSPIVQWTDAHAALWPLVRSSNSED